MPQNTVDVCDIIEKDRQEKSPVTVLADNSIMYGIREYNANIQKVMEEMTDTYGICLKAIIVM